MRLPTCGHAAPTSRLPMPLPRVLRNFLLLSAALWCVCLGCEAYCYYVLHLPGGGGPLGSCYTWPVMFFHHWADAGTWVERFQHIHSPAVFSGDPALGEPFTYPAPAVFLFLPFYALGKYRLVGFAAVAFALGAVLLAGFHGALVRAGLTRAKAAGFLAAVVLLSYPMWFEFGLGNAEIWVWFLVAFGVWAYVTDRPYTAATLFAAATACKLFPLVYFGLFLARRRYAPIAWGAALVVVLNGIGLWTMDPNLRAAIAGVKWGMGYFRQAYVLKIHFVTGFDHSLFGLLKVYARTLFQLSPEGMARFLNVYLACAAVLGLAAYVLVIRRLPLINQVLALTVASVLFTPASHDYTLLHLYVPWAMLVLLALRDPEARRSRGLAAALVCLAIAMSPETEVILAGGIFGGQIKCLALMVLFGLSLRADFGARTAGELAVAC